MKTISLRCFTLICLTLALSGCTTYRDLTGGQAQVPPSVLPTSQYALEAETFEEAPVHLRLTSDTLSANQRTALDKLSARAVNADVIVTTGPSPQAISHGYRVKNYLLAQGVDDRAIRYQTVASHPGDIVSLTLIAYRARQIACNRSWENLSRTADNQPYTNYGCAVTANLAAQIDDPRDIAAPQGATPADAGRKTTIIDKYRKGEATAAAPEAAAASEISDAVK